MNNIFLIFLGSNNKEGSSKSKPSELNTLGLKIGNYKVENHEILTKIFFGKKQFVWELTEINNQNTNNDENLIKKENLEGNNPENNEQIHHNGKKKLEIKFSDIENVNLNLEKSTMEISKKNKKLYISCY